MEIKLIQIFTA